MVKRTVLDVGNCAPDHAAIKKMLCANFSVDVLQTHGAQDTLQLLRRQPVDLVLINRKLDMDYSDGTEILKQIKADPQLQSTPIMLITNYDEHQASAVARGAELGFGKLSLNAAETQQRLASLLH